MDGKFKEGDFVLAKNNPFLKLKIRRYVSKIYYCTVLEEPTRKELVFFERELMFDESIAKS
jgi:hypothetical protein